MLLARNYPASTDCEEVLALLTQIGCARCPEGPAGQLHGRHLCRFDFCRTKWTSEDGADANGTHTKTNSQDQSCSLVLNQWAEST